MLTAVARDGWNLSAVFNFVFVLFCYITNHLMIGPLGNSEFCFPRISMFPSTSSRETLRFSGNKINCAPRDQSLSVKYSLVCLSVITSDAGSKMTDKPFFKVSTRVLLTRKIHKPKETDVVEKHSVLTN